MTKWAPLSTGVHLKRKPAGETPQKAASAPLGLKATITISADPDTATDTMRKLM